MTTPNLGEDAKKLNNSYCWWNLELYIHFRKSLAVSYKLTHAITKGPRYSLLSIHPWEMKSLYSLKNLCINVHRSFLHNNKKLETVPLPSNWTHIHPMQYDSAIKNKEWLDNTTTCMNLQGMLLNEANPKGNIL